jgi:hypothetical protein
MIDSLLKAHPAGDGFPRQRLNARFAGKQVKMRLRNDGHAPAVSGMEKLHKPDH